MDEVFQTLPPQLSQALAYVKRIEQGKSGRFPAVAISLPYD